MYNECQKSRYLNFLKKRNSGSINMYDWLFNKIEEFELKLGKDIYDFTFEEVIYMYKMFNLRELSTLNTINTMLAQYTKWAISEGLVKINQNVMSLISVDQLTEYLNKAALNLKIISREELLQIIKDLENPRDQFILLALFEFGKGENFYDIVFAKTEAINSQESTMTLYSGRTVKVSRELIHYALDSDETDTYTRTFDDGSVRSYQLYNNGTIIKTMKITEDKNRLASNTYVSATKRLKEAGTNLSVKNIIESGEIYFIKEDMNKLNISSLEDYFRYPERNERINRIKNQFMISNIIVKRFINTYGDLF